MTRAEAEAKLAEHRRAGSPSSTERQAVLEQRGREQGTISAPFWPNPEPEPRR